MDKIPISVDKLTIGARIAQVVGLTSAAFLSGAIGGISFMTVPALLDAPAPLLAKQWQKVFDTGKVVAPPLSILSSAIFGGLAYRAPKGSASVTLYSIAAILVPSIVPYTLLVMKPINDKLAARASSTAAAESDVAKEETAQALLDKWAVLNLGRSFLPLIGALCAGWAMADNYEVLGLADVVFKSGANRLG